MSSSELESMFSSAVRAWFPPLSPCATIIALMTSSQPILSGNFASHKRMYSMSFSVTHNLMTEISEQQKALCYLLRLRIKANRAFSLTWPASTQMYWNKKKSVCIRKGFVWDTSMAAVLTIVVTWSPSLKARIRTFHVVVVQRWQ